MDGLTAYTICPPKFYLTEDKIPSVVTPLSFISCSELSICAQM